MASSFLLPPSPPQEASDLFPFLTHTYTHTYVYKRSLVAPLVKSLPAVQETWVQSLGQEDLLEKEMTAHSSILA